MKDHPIQQHKAASPENASPEAEGKGKSMTPPAFQLKASEVAATPPPAAQGSKGGGLPADLVSGFAASTGHDLSDVNVVRNSDKPAQVGALAYAQGNDIHLAAGQDQHLAHEAAHIVQQREGRVQATTEVAGKPVNDSKHLESEADSMGAKAMQMKGAGEAGLKTANTSTKTAQMKAAPGSVAQLKIQESGMKVKNGEFAIDMKDQSSPPETKAGEKGTVKFKPIDSAPDTTDIKLVQIVKTNDMTKTPPKDYDWSTSAEADRMKVQTTASETEYTTLKGDTLKKISASQTSGHIPPNELFETNKALLKSGNENDEIAEGTKIKIPKAQGGYFVDHAAASTTATPRTGKGDAQVPINYRSYWPNTSNSQDGSKSGKTINEASLWDFPGGGSTFDIKFDFETVARSYDKGFDFGTLHWGFHLNKGKIEGEYHHVAEGTSPTFAGAIKEFNKFYQNKHKVVEGETLESLAELYLGDKTKSAEIAKANGITDGKITPGQELIIPGVTNIT